MTPRLILSTLKRNNMTPKALKLHLQSIKLQKSFYSSNFFYFTCAMMSRFAKFQVFFSLDHSHLWLGKEHWLNQLLSNTWMLLFYKPVVGLLPRRELAFSVFVHRINMVMLYITKHHAFQFCLSNLFQLIPMFVHCIYTCILVLHFSFVNRWKFVRY
jgi:hypothetical protein